MDEQRTSGAGVVAIAVGALVAIYLAVSIVIPYDVEIGLVDEPIFASSAFEFADTGKIVLEDLSAPTAVFDTVWGGLFARALGKSYEALRLSTVFLVALSVIPFYWLCRQLGGTVRTALIACAAYLFNPLSISLAYSFQTDAHAVALGVPAIAFFVAAFKNESRRGVLFVLGSAFTAVAYLSRQQGLVIAIAALLAWLVKGPRGRERLFGTVAIVLLPVAVFIGHARWIDQVGEPLIRTVSLSQAMDLNWLEILPRVLAAAVPWAMYSGLFLLTLAPLLKPSRSDMLAAARRPLLTGMAVSAVVVSASIGLGYLSLFGPQTWVTISGFGGVDRSNLGWRPDLIPPWLQAIVALALLTSLAFLTLKVIPRLRWRFLTMTSLFVVLGSLGFIAAALLSSLAFHGRVLDRYWLPLLPLFLAGAVALTRETRRAVIASTAIVVVLGTVGLVGTRDAFVANAAIADFADDVVASGVPLRSVDGGAGWLAKQFGVNDLDALAISAQFGLRPWWVLFYASTLQPSYAISHEAIEGYEVLKERSYSSWLHIVPTRLYLLHRVDPEGFYIPTADF